MTQRAFVGVGANLGDPSATVQAAVDELARLPGSTLLACSRPWRSRSIGADGPDFVNAVAALDTTLGPVELLDALLAIESRHGRERSIRNAPRTLDLDLLLFGDAVRHDARLTLPHPRLHERLFVLGPLAEIAPSLTIAGIGPVVDALGRVRDQDAAPVAGSDPIHPMNKS